MVNTTWQKFIISFSSEGEIQRNFCYKSRVEMVNFDLAPFLPVIVGYEFCRTLLICLGVGDAASAPSPLQTPSLEQFKKYMVDLSAWKNITYLSENMIIAILVI